VVYVSESLDSRHDTSRFRSGQPELDRWLANHALNAAARRAARTFVWHAGGNNVVAYYTIVAHLIVRADLPRSLAHGNPDQIPAVLLARLALDETLHGQKLGGALLAEALGRIVAATEIVTARYVVVDAIDENAATFYEHYGFRPVPSGRRLVQKIPDIAAGLADVR
jgi:GNAT superfamily N-acetyltransferase